MTASITRSSIWCYDLSEVGMLYDAVARHHKDMRPTRDKR